MLSFLGFATQDWYRLARETGRALLTVSDLGTIYHDCRYMWAAVKYQGVFEY